MSSRSQYRLQLLAGVAMTLSFVAASPSFAQAAAVSAAGAASSEMAGGSVVAEDGADTADTPVSLEEVVVTATKRETSLQKTPVAISVVGEAAVEARHVDSLLDLGDGSIPSLRIATFEARQSALTIGIRGIVPFDANQTARDQGTGVYIDGVYLGRQQGLNAALFDIQRIEVLRGPQGTLFGRNTEGGALSIVTKGPTGEFGGRMLVGVGNYASYTGELHLNLPEYANFSVKLDALKQHQDPTTRNPLEGQAGWNQYDRTGGRLSVRWQPTDAFTADVSVDHARDENTPFYSQLLNYNPLGKTVRTVAEMQVSPVLPAGYIAPLPALVEVHTDRQKVAEIGVPQQPSVDITQGVSANLSYVVSPALELRSITAAREVTTHQWDNSGGAHRVAFSPNGKFSRYSLSDLSQDQFSQEFQAIGSLSQVDYVVGAYYFKEHAEESAATPSSNQWNADGTAYSILNPIAPNAGWIHGYRALQRASKADAESWAVFGQFTYTPAALDRLHLTAGGRYTHDDRNGTLYIVQNKPANFTFNFKEGRFDPMVTLSFDAADGINLYVKYATGYRAGGANDRSQTFAAFGSEEVKSYEIGSKMDLLDRRLRLNLAAFATNRSGTQTDFDNVDTNPLSPTFNLHTEETRNAPGTSKIRGFEAELTTRPVEGVTLGLSYAYTKVDVPPTPNPFLGNKLTQVNTVFTPENAASAFVDFEAPVDFMDAIFRAHLDANYADAQYSFQSESVKTDSSFIMNGSIALDELKMPNGSQGTLRLWSRNLLNEEHVYRRSAANAGVLGDYGNFNPPRTFGVELTVNF